MRFLVAKNNLLKAIHERNVAATIAIGLLLANIFLSLQCCAHQERVIVAPMYTGNGFWLDRKNVSSTYLEEVTVFLANQLLDASPEAFSFQRDIILRYVAPEYFHELKKILIDEESRYHREVLATSFRPTAIKVEPKSLTAIITGVIDSYVAGNKVKQTSNSYKLTYRLKDGRLLLKSFQILSEGKNDI